MRIPAGPQQRRGLARAAVALVLTAGATAGCHAQDAAPTTARYGDDKQLRDVYTLLVDALGHHDTAEHVRLTCAEYRGDVQRRADEDPILQIGFFGTPEEVSQLGVDAAADRLLTALAPASRDAVHAVAQAIIDGDAARYRTAIQRVEREGSSATLDRIDKIEVTGDTAVVNGAYTIRAFNRPPEVVVGANHAVREDGNWKDCTPPTQR